MGSRDPAFLVQHADEMLGVGGVGDRHGAVERDVAFDGSGDGAADEAYDFVDPAAFGEFGVHGGRGVLSAQAGG